MFNFADVAQLVEHALGKGEVTDSSSVVGSIFVLARLDKLGKYCYYNNNAGIAKRSNATDCKSVGPVPS